MKSTWPKLLILTLLLVGCVPVEPMPAQTTPCATQPAEPATPTQSLPPSTRDTGPGPGISYEENLRINPPMVQNLVAGVTSEGVLLTWQAPPEVTVPHSYGDEILGYKIYRRSGDEKRALLAETQDLRYLDGSTQAGVEYFYTVTALHAHNIESTRPDEVSAIWTPVP